MILSQRIRFLFKIACALSIFGVILLFSGRYVVTYKAENKAQNIIAEAYKNYSSGSVEEKVFAIARQIFADFEHIDPNKILLYRFRAYLTNSRLPDFIRLPEGVIETHLEMGFCDNASRMLAFLLDQEGISSVQWNMVGNTTAHSARLVTLSSGETIFVDPFYGYVAIDMDKTPIHILKAQELVRLGAAIDEVFIPLDKNSDPRFYNDLDIMRMAAQGDDLILETTLPHINDEPIFFGTVNGDERDIRSTSAKYGIMPFWDYVGHKYDRKWVRVLKAEQSVRIVITLTSPVETSVLTTTPEPLVMGNTLTWELSPGESIIFRDGLAQISFKRLNSYINVDQIAVYPQA